MHPKLKKIKGFYRYIPTSLTLGNSLLGFSAILNTLQVYVPDRGVDIPHVLAISAWMIICAMIFDMLDGWAARLLNAHSEHGMQMDSLADMCTFGVAPAVLVAVMAHTYELQVLDYRWVWLFTAIYLGCVALRLALYNVMAMRGTEESSHAFHGLPSPGGAAAVCSVVILHSIPHYESKLIAQLLPFYAAILGFLMVSPIPYMHVGHWLGSKRRNMFKILAVIIFFGLFSLFGHLVAAVVINLYVLSGPVAVVYKWLRSKGEAEEEPDLC